MMFLTLMLLLLPASPATPAAASSATSPNDQYDRLLSTWVVDDRWVDYDGWRADEADHQSLKDYIRQTANLDFANADEPTRLAAWINLYNAVTIELILDRGPVESIKDLGGPITSAWEHKLVTVGGRELTLNDIEHGILRVEFHEPRIHFALNCASVGCPPLRAEAYRADRIDQQLDEAAARVVRDPAWVDLSGCTGAYSAGAIRLTRIFDWFSDDFGGSEGVRNFLIHYRPEDRFQLMNTGCGLEFIDYDWTLNAPPTKGQTQGPTQGPTQGE